MIYSVLIFIIFIAFLFLVTRKTKWATVTIAFALLLSFALGQSFAVKLLLGELQKSPPLQNPLWKQNNLIVLLGSGKVRWEQSDELQNTITPLNFGLTRLLEASRLYMNCKKQNSRCLILISGGDPNQLGVSEARVMADKLQELGTAETDIILEEHSRNTIENAKFSSELIKKINYDTIILVTSGFHLERAKLCFNYFNIFPELAPADQLRPVESIWPQATNLYLVNLGLHEFGGIIQVAIKNMTNSL